MDCPDLEIVRCRVSCSPGTESPSGCETAQILAIVLAYSWLLVQRMIIAVSTLAYRMAPPVPPVSHAEMSYLLTSFYYSWTDSTVR